MASFVPETTEPGIVAGLVLLDPLQSPADAGQWQVMVHEGQQVEAGAVLVEIQRSAAQIGIAEDYMVGPLGFASGIASRAARFKAACPPGLASPVVAGRSCQLHSNLRYVQASLR